MRIRHVNRCSFPLGPTRIRAYRCGDVADDQARHHASTARELFFSLSRNRTDAWIACRLAFLVSQAARLHTSITADYEQPESSLLLAPRGVQQVDSILQCCSTVDAEVALAEGPTGDPSPFTYSNSAHVICYPGIVCDPIPNATSYY